MSYFVDVISKCFDNWLWWNYSYKIFNSFMSNIGCIIAVSLIALLFGTGILLAIINEVRR
jgi:hypothetical protein